MEQDWARVCPSAVNRPAEASSPSFTMGEKEDRSSVACISFAMPSSRCRVTSTVTGSRLAVLNSVAITRHPSR